MVGGAALYYSPYFWMDHVTVSSVDIRRFRRTESLVLSIFAHPNYPDLLFDCLGVYLIGPTCCALFGGTGFLALYLTAGVVGNLTHVLAASPEGRKLGLPPVYNEAMPGGLPASEALLASIAVLHPRMTVSLFGVVPMPIGLLAAGIAAWDVYSIREGQSHKVTGLAGLCWGGLFGLVFRRGFRRF